MGLNDVNGIIKDGLTSALSNYFDKEKTERLIESNEDGAWVLYCMLRHYEYNSMLGLDLDKLKNVGCGTVEESTLELLIREGFLIKEGKEYFIPQIHFEEKLRQEKENGQQSLFSSFN